MNENQIKTRNAIVLAYDKENKNIDKITHMCTWRLFISPHFDIFEHLLVSS